MSFSITDAFVQQYRDNVMILSQQKGSKLRMLVRSEEGVVGKRSAFERLGSTAAVKRTSRHADTPLVSSPHSRRWANLEDWDWADLVDKLDKVKMLISPQSEYAINAAYAMGRSIDDIIIAALGGTAVTGEEAAGSQALPAAQKITTAGGLTLAKLRNAKLILDKANVVDEDRVAVINAEALADMLADSTITSHDFNSVKALVDGQINTFLGFNFVRTEQLKFKSGSTTLRLNYFYQKNGAGLAVGQDIITRISERSDKNYSVQVYLCMSFGSVRVEDESVVEMEVDET